MKPRAVKHPDEAPVISNAQLEELRTKLLAAPKTPLFPVGTETQCQACGGKMITTNDLEKAVPTPVALFIISNLPGARCLSCEAVAYDPAALAIIEAHSAHEVIADYETSVTTAGGKTLGTYFKADLARVLMLKGKEHLRWKVLGRNRVLVEVERG